jgi:hypothetical protein
MNKAGRGVVSASMTRIRAGIRRPVLVAVSATKKTSTLSILDKKNRVNYEGVSSPVISRTKRTE